MSFAYRQTFISLLIFGLLIFFQTGLQRAYRLKIHHELDLGKSFQILSNELSKVDHEHYEDSTKTNTPPESHIHQHSCSTCSHHHHHSNNEHKNNEIQEISNGLILILQYLGLRELAANLLWIQMDSDSHKGLWHRVEFALELIPAIDPHFVEAFLLLAFVEDVYHKQHDKSKEILKTGIKYNPFRSELWIQLGVEYLNLSGKHGPTRNPEKALEAFEAACKLADCPGHVFRFKAIAMCMMGKYEEAEKWMEEVIKMPGRSDYDIKQDKILIQKIKARETW